MEKRVKCLFRLDHPTAEQVFVLREFNHLSTSAVPMRRGEAGQWEAIVELHPGRQSYCYIALVRGDDRSLRSELLWAGRVLDVSANDAGAERVAPIVCPLVCVN